MSIAGSKGGIVGQTCDTGLEIEEFAYELRKVIKQNCIDEDIIS